MLDPQALLHWVELFAAATGICSTLILFFLWLRARIKFPFTQKESDNLQETVKIKDELIDALHQQIELMGTKHKDELDKRDLRAEAQDKVISEQAATIADMQKRIALMENKMSLLSSAMSDKIVLLKETL